MKNSMYILLVSVPVYILPFCTTASGSKEKESGHAQQPGAAVTGYKNVAVLELFTSQGCSSCPAADRLLGKYASKENVIALSFHVDYWNHLGWKDPFSSKQFSARQYNYAAAMKAEVYTPQLVVNGQSEMVGSDEGKISAAIKKALEQPSAVALSIKKLQPGNGSVTIHCIVSGNTGNAFLNIALIEKMAETQINAGENRGVTLTNYNVVRNFKTIDDVNTGDNTSVIDISSDTDKSNMSVVAFIQQKGTNRILTADLAGL
jgi:hypothetical protein